MVFCDFVVVIALTFCFVFFVSEILDALRRKARGEPYDLPNHFITVYSANTNNNSIAVPTQN